MPAIIRHEVRNVYIDRVHTDLLTAINIPRQICTNVPEVVRITYDLIGSRKHWPNLVEIIWKMGK